MAVGGAPMAEAKEKTFGGVPALSLALRGAMRQPRAGPYMPLLFLPILWMLACLIKRDEICGAADGPLPLAP